ncbi:spexin [Platysternon megacephalum]|uniref:Spexin n=1 Tax=Platysternon megacephalum TaxID=55544 RepID=A0A4D9E499_9SAUR|nr:spexin [Platysternon megacephalum]
MDLVSGLVWLLTVLLEGISGQGVYGTPNHYVLESRSPMCCTLQNEEECSKLLQISPEKSDCNPQPFA